MDFVRYFKLPNEPGYGITLMGNCDLSTKCADLAAAEAYCNAMNRTIAEKSKSQETKCDHHVNCSKCGKHLFWKE